MILQCSTLVLLVASLQFSQAAVQWLTRQYTIGYGKNAVMKCSYSNEFDSFIDNLGQTITTQGRYTISDDSPGIMQLEIKDLQDADYGNYTCTNSLGEKAVVLLTIGATILDPVTPQYVVVGSVGVVRASVLGMPRPDIHWTYAGRRIVTLTSAGKLTLGRTAVPGMYDVEPGGSLKILNVTLANSGRYTIYEEDVNIGAKTEKIISVEAGAKPTISKRPDESYSLFIGDKITLPCEWSVAPTDLSWTYTNSSGSVNLVSGVDRAKGLTIDSAQPANAGTYVCTGTNKFGNDTARTKIVSVVKLVKPQIVSDFGPELTRLAGETLDLNCAAVGEPALHLKWEKVETAVRKVLMDGQLSSAYLKLFRLKESDAGTYVCTASVDAKNPDGTYMNVSRSTMLRVKVPPVVVDSPRDMATALGKVIALTCEATGNPIPSLAFYRGDTLLGEPTVATSGNTVRAVLQLNVSKADFTTLLCNASSQYGVDVKEFKLKEVVKPAAPGNVSGRSGLDYIELTWSAPAGPVDGYWLSINSSAFSSVQEEASDGSSFLYKGLLRNTEYVFAVAAENVAGRSELSLPFSIRTKDINRPSPPAFLSVSDVGVDHVLLSWSPSAGNVDSYTVKVSSDAGDVVCRETRATEIMLVSLQRNVDYLVRVAGRNVAGVGLFSTALQVRTLAATVPDKPTSLKADVSGVTVTLSWNKPDNTKDDPLQFTVKLCEVVVNETGVCSKQKSTASTSYELIGLKENTEYTFEVQASNQGVLGEATKDSFKTQAKPAPTPLPSKGKLGSGAVAGIIIAIIVILLVVVDVFCCFFNNCGFTHCCFETFCAAKGKGKYAPTDAAEETRELKEAKSDADVV